MVEVISALEPRFFNKGEFIYPYQENTWKEALYVMDGKYKVGFYAIIDNVE